MPKASKSKQKGRPSGSVHAIDPELDPVWFDPLAPVGSALRELLGLSGRIFWVGLHAKGQSSRTAPRHSIGKLPEASEGIETQELLLPVKNPAGEDCATIRILYGKPSLASVEFAELAKKVAQELGERWPE